ncbi:MAG: hypothetical protein H3C34_23015 [Caldilineaceae bacterium]|nr:hypothetical protein [Caldilineaceae bacterium]
MKPSKVVIWLSLLIALLAAVAAGTGLFWQDGGSPFSFTTVRGDTVQMYGQGLYRYDTLFIGAGTKGVDAVILFLAIPLIVVTILFYRRGSLRAGLLLLGTLAYFLYVYASMALGAAYNNLFLVYVVLFSASLFAFVLVFASIDRQALPAHFSPQLPRRGPALFMFAGGLVTLVVWGEPLVAALLQNRPPERMDSYTTMVTYALDLAIITPATILSGVLILRRNPLGYLIAFPLLVVVVLLGPQIAVSTTFQVSAGVSFPPAQIVGPIAGFAVLGLLAIWILVALLRNIADSAQQKRSTAGRRKR